MTLFSAKKEMSTPKMNEATETIWSPESYMPPALATNTHSAKRTMHCDSLTALLWLPGYSIKV